MPLFDAVVTADVTNTVATVGHTITTAPNRLLVIAVTSDGGTISSMTWGGVALTPLTPQLVLNTALDVWYLVNPASGTDNAVITMSIPSDMAIRVISYSDVRQDIPFGTVATATGVGTAVSVTVASNPGELVIDADSGDAITTAAAGGGQTERGKTLVGLSKAYGSEAPGVASVAMTWTLDNPAAHWQAIGVSLKAPTGSPSLIGSFIPPLAWATRIRS